MAAKSKELETCEAYIPMKRRGNAKGRNVGMDKSTLTVKKMNKLSNINSDGGRCLLVAADGWSVYPKQYRSTGGRSAER